MLKVDETMIVGVRGSIVVLAVVVVVWYAKGFNTRLVWYKRVRSEASPVASIVIYIHTYTPVSNDEKMVDLWRVIFQDFQLRLEKKKVYLYRSNLW